MIFFKFGYHWLRLVILGRRMTFGPYKSRGAALVKRDKITAK